jgi:hypothetical protein
LNKRGEKTANFRTQWPYWKSIAYHL